MATNNRAKWGICFGMTAAFIVAGALASTTARPANAAETAEHTETTAQVGAQTPTPTPGGNQLAQGRQIYDRACGRCHPGGEEDVGPRIINKNLDQARALKQIREGTGRMRAIPPTKLPDANIPALMTYLRSIHTVR